MRPLKQLEDENAKLKKIVADLSIDREMLQDVRARARRNGGGGHLRYDAFLQAYLRGEVKRLAVVARLN